MFPDLFSILLQSFLFTHYSDKFPVNITWRFDWHYKSFMTLISVVYDFIRKPALHSTKLVSSCI